MTRTVTHSLVKALRGVPGFSSLDDRMLLAVVGDSANLVWEAGSTVVAKGSPGDALFIVLSGAVRILDDAGAEVTVLRTGDFFGEFSLVLDIERMNDLVAAEETELMVVPKESFDRLPGTSDDLGRQVRKRFEERLPEELRAQLAS